MIFGKAEFLLAFIACNRCISNIEGNSAAAKGVFDTQERSLEDPQTTNPELIHLNPPKRDNTGSHDSVSSDNTHSNSLKLSDECFLNLQFKIDEMRGHVNPMDENTVEKFKNYEQIIINSFNFSKAITYIAEITSMKDKEGKEKCRLFYLLVQMHKLLENAFYNIEALNEQTTAQASALNDSRNNEIAKIKSSFFCFKMHNILKLSEKILNTMIENNCDQTEAFAKYYSWSLEPSINLYDEFRILVYERDFSVFLSDVIGLQNKMYNEIYGKSDEEKMLKWNESVKLYFSNLADMIANGPEKNRENNINKGDDRQDAARMTATHLNTKKTSESVVTGGHANRTDAKTKHRGVFDSSDDEDDATNPGKPKKLTEKEFRVLDNDIDKRFGEAEAFYAKIKDKYTTNELLEKVNMFIGELTNASEIRKGSNDWDILNKYLIEYKDLPNIFEKNKERFNDISDKYNELVGIYNAFKIMHYVESNFYTEVQKKVDLIMPLVEEITSTCENLDRFYESIKRRYEKAYPEVQPIFVSIEKEQKENQEKQARKNSEEQEVIGDRKIPRKDIEDSSKPVKTGVTTEADSTKNTYNVANGRFGTGYRVASDSNQRQLNQSHSNHSNSSHSNSNHSNSNHSNSSHSNSSHSNSSHSNSSQSSRVVGGPSVVGGPRVESHKTTDENIVNGGFEAGRLDEGKGTKQSTETKSVKSDSLKNNPYKNNNLVKEALEYHAIKEQKRKHGRKVEDFMENGSRENILGGDATDEDELSGGSSKTNIPKGQGTSDNEKDNSGESKSYFKECAAIGIAGIVICAVIFAFFKA
ncbi:hypothetical protein ENBRE01_1565 [Enteropsectra breve]|nr:hypothetical protein ENBRE01_1565 [Enteropsectra breve]